MSNNLIIVGGGFAGSMVATQQMLNIIKHEDINIDISIYDSSGLIGRGEPYKVEENSEDIFLLNQPVSEMSPFNEDPDHFLNWLIKNNYDSTIDDFIPRGVYGSYLNEVFAEARSLYESSGCGKVEVIKATVTDIDKLKNNNYNVISDNNEPKQANVVILTPGHSKSNLLSEYIDNNKYFSSPLDVEKAKESLKEAKEPALIVGTSQSMLDALALLDYIGFENDIYAISRDMNKPWMFDAKRERSVNGVYNYEFLTKDVLSDGSAYSFECLKSLFDKDVENGKKYKFPLAHIFSQFKKEDLELCINNPITKSSFDKLALYARSMYGNPTSPKRYKLMKQYEDSGQLKFIKGDVTDFKINPISTGFEIQKKGSKAKSISAIFNAASYTMKTISDNGLVALPLLNVLDGKNALKRSTNDKNAFSSGKQNWTGLYLAGPSCNSQKWGVGTFRKSITDVSRQSVAEIRHKMQRKA